SINSVATPRILLRRTTATVHSRAGSGSTPTGGVGDFGTSKSEFLGQGEGSGAFALELLLGHQFLPDPRREARRRGDPRDSRPLAPSPAQPRLVVEPGQLEAFLERFVGAFLFLFRGHMDLLPTGRIGPSSRQHGRAYSTRLLKARDRRGGRGSAAVDHSRKAAIVSRKAVPSSM